MSEGIAAQITSIVRHELAEAHHLLSELLARLPAAPDHLASDRIHTNGVGQVKPVTSRQPSPETVSRRERKKRAAVRKAANRTAEPDEEPIPEPPSGWPALRQEVRSRLIERGLSHAQAAAEIGEVKRGTFSTWLSRDVPVPSERSQSRIRKWLRELPVTAPDAEPVDPPPVYTLSEPEQASLRGHLSLGVDRELRQQFGIARGVLEQAAGGEHMAGEIIARLGTVLMNGAAPE
jgi:hypothetical protein